MKLGEKLKGMRKEKRLTLDKLADIPVDVRFTYAY